MDRNGNGMGWKCLLVKKDTRVFLAKQINGTKGLSIEREKSWADLKFFRITGASAFVLMTVSVTRLGKISPFRLLFT
jgi:hypothetical protein